MIKKITAVTLLGMCAAYYLYPETGEQLDASPDAALRSAGDALQPQASTAAERSSAPDPTVVADSSIADDESFDDGTEMVLGLRVRKDRNCTVQLREYVTPEGEMFSAYSCTPNNPPPPNPLAHYDNEALATMAYSDADAAAELGHRLIASDTPRAYEMLVRASALDGGNTLHLTWLAEQAFGAIAINGEPQLDNLSRQYELAAVAVQLGDSPYKFEYLKSELARFGVGADQLRELDARANELLQSMRDIQQTVHGEITLGGQGDA